MTTKKCSKCGEPDCSGDCPDQKVREVRQPQYGHWMPDDKVRGKGGTSQNGVRR